MGKYPLKLTNEYTTKVLKDFTLLRAVKLTFCD